MSDRMDDEAFDRQRKIAVMGNHAGLRAFRLLEADHVRSRTREADLERDNAELRRLLWLRHDPKHTAILYGDDGEMQCGECLLDFKRMSPKEIEQRFVALGASDLTPRHTCAAMWEPGGECDPQCPAYEPNN